jgi:hypothetical protein
MLLDQQNGITIISYNTAPSSDTHYPTGLLSLPLALGLTTHPNLQ